MGTHNSTARPLRCGAVRCCAVASCHGRSQGSYANRIGGFRDEPIDACDGSSRRRKRGRIMIPRLATTGSLLPSRTCLDSTRRGLSGCPDSASSATLFVTAGGEREADEGDREPRHGDGDDIVDRPSEGQESVLRSRAWPPFLLAAASGSSRMLARLRRAIRACHPPRVAIQLVIDENSIAADDPGRSKFRQPSMGSRQLRFNNVRALLQPSPTIANRAGHG